MRSDMFKVIVERPRRGRATAKAMKGVGRSPNRQADFESMPTKESMKNGRLRGYNRKELNENLSPLERFFRSRVGKPWDKVMSEISASVGPGNNPVKNHIYQHIDQMVETHAIKREDGVWCYLNRWSRDHALYPIGKGELFVNSETGILTLQNKNVKRKKRSSWYSKLDSFNLDDKNLFLLINGVWWHLEMKPFDKSEIKDAVALDNSWFWGDAYIEKRDAHLGYQPSMTRISNTYGNDSFRYCVAKTRADWFAKCIEDYDKSFKALRDKISLALRKKK